MCKASQLKFEGEIQCLKEILQGGEEKQRAKERETGEWVPGAQGRSLHVQFSPRPGEAL